MVAPPERGAISGTGPHGREADILLEVPIAHHADVAPAVEDRSYIVFIAGALAVALCGGFILAILLALAESGLVWEQRVPWLIQTLTGIERGKYYFFQSPGNVTVPMN